MNNDSVSIVPITPKSTFGDRIRILANQLRQENAVQIKATSRILGAAAKLAENHDRLIDEVVEMVEEDLDQQSQIPQSQLYTVEQLKQQFAKLSDAKTHFGIKASSWNALVEKLNEQIPAAPPSSRPSAYPPQDAICQRLEAIEQEIQSLQGDMTQVLKLLHLMVEKLL